MEEKNKYFIYIYEHNASCLYVGRTTNLKRRDREHKRNDEWYKDVTRLIYSECQNETDQILYEVYYIAKLRPRENRCKIRVVSSLVLPELNFISYEEDLREKMVKVSQTSFKRRYSEYQIFGDPVQIQDKMSLFSLLASEEQLCFKKDSSLYTFQGLSTLSKLARDILLLLLKKGEKFVAHGTLHLTMTYTAFLCHLEITDSFYTKKILYDAVHSLQNLVFLEKRLVSQSKSILCSHYINWTFGDQKISISLNGLDSLNLLFHDIC
ncbi:GIY-YIG nuclease family protein [Brevibacillus brevis]|uniref:GIY-YIG nuclease family protein n=1 Tax=Brevibacillus brevis TaxID=1393 RepID=UPI00339A91B2